MVIGVPKEIKTLENRVGLTPAHCADLIKMGHTLIVETSAGDGSGFSNEDYQNAGATIGKATDVYSKAELVIKVKEPLEKEYGLIRKGQTIFTYFHFASSRQLTEAMMQSGAVCISYETVEKADRSLPLLIPMSEVAGRMAVQKGANFLEKHNQGKGILLGGVPGVKPAHVLILGGGIVGANAARMAAGLGANVTIMDINVSRLRHLSDIMPANVTTLYSSQSNINEAVKTADLIIGAILVPGAKAPVLITREMLKTMKPGTVLVDVAVDQGGCIETCKPTTHENPTYMVDGIVHYCVANMPGAVPSTSTHSLTNATFPYVCQLASKGWQKACKENPELKLGLNVVNGQIVYKKIAEAFGLPFSEVDQHLG